MPSRVLSSAKPSTTLCRARYRRLRASCAFQRRRVSQTHWSRRCSARSRYRTPTSGCKFWSPIGMLTISLTELTWRFGSAHLENHRWLLEKSLPFDISSSRAPLNLKRSKLQDLRRICSLTNWSRSRIGDPAGAFVIKTEKIRKRCRSNRICQ